MSAILWSARDLASVVYAAEAAGAPRMFGAPDEPAREMAADLATISHANLEHFLGFYRHRSDLGDAVAADADDIMRELVTLRREWGLGEGREHGEHPCRRGLTTAQLLRYNLDAELGAEALEALVRVLQRFLPRR